jgi:glycoprotein endo-alpha-1,2-mannosidase
VSLGLHKQKGRLVVTRVAKLPRPCLVLILGLGMLAVGCGRLNPSEDNGCGSSKPDLAAPARARALPAVPRRVLAFYYPWFGTPTGPSGVWRHWNPNLPHYGVAHTPLSGVYDSKDTAVLRRHAQQARAAGIDTLISSWWGAGQFEDDVLPAVLQAAQAEGLSVSVLIETAGTCNDLRNEMKYLLDRHATSPAWLRVDGRPVLFIYGRVVEALDSAEFRSVLRGFDAFTVADTLSSDQADPFDGVFQYNPAPNVAGYVQALPGDLKRHHDAGRLFAASAVPGYDDTSIRTPGLQVDRQGGALYGQMWQAAASADWVTITTWNEWQEGSEIEPSFEFGSQYLDLTRSLSDVWRR